MNPSEILAGARGIPADTIRMVVNESALATGIAMHVAVALRFLDKDGPR